MSDEANVRIKGRSRYPVCGPHTGAQSSSAQQWIEPLKRPQIRQWEFIGPWAVIDLETPRRTDLHHIGALDRPSLISRTSWGHLQRPQTSQGLWQIGDDLWNVTPWGLVNKFRPYRQLVSSNFIVQSWRRTRKFALEQWCLSARPHDVTHRTLQHFFGEMTISTRKFTVVNTKCLV